MARLTQYQTNQDARAKKIPDPSKSQGRGAREQNPIRGPASCKASFSRAVSRGWVRAARQAGKAPESPGRSETRGKRLERRRGRRIQQGGGGVNGVGTVSRHCRHQKLHRIVGWETRRDEETRPRLRKLCPKRPARGKKRDDSPNAS